MVARDPALGVGAVLEERKVDDPPLPEADVFPPWKPFKDPASIWLNSARLPQPATTGRPRVYCGPACRKAAYDDRRARTPEAFQVRVVERTVVETVETISTVDEGHDISECVRRVCGSPRGVTNVLSALEGLVRSGTLQFDGKWAPVVRAIAELNRAILDASSRDPWRRRQ